MKSRIAAVVAVTVAAAAVLLAGMKRVLKRVFAPPRRDMRQTPQDLGLAAETVWLDSVRGTRLHAWFIPVGEAAPAVAVLHGWTGNASHLLPLAPSLHAAGFHALFLDARNHGLSEDDDHTSMPRFAEDLDVAVRYLRGRTDVTSVAIIGHSVGASAAILAAATGTSPDAVVAVAAFAHPGELMEQHFRFPRPVMWALLRAVEIIIGYRYRQIASRNRIGEVTAPLLLVHGDRDDVVPVADAYELHRRSPHSELLIVPGGTHSDFDTLEPCFAQVAAFLGNALVGSRNVQESIDVR